MVDAKITHKKFLKKYSAVPTRDSLGTLTKNCIHNSMKMFPNSFQINVRMLIETIKYKRETVYFIREYPNVNLRGLQPDRE